MEKLTPEELEQMRQQLEPIPQKQEEQEEQLDRKLTPEELDNMKLALAKDGNVRDKVSPMKSAAMGVAQGLTLGTSDEISAALDSAPAMLIHHLASRYVGKPASLSQLGTHYKMELSKQRKELKRAQQDNPYWYGGGDFVGSLASYAYGGGGLTLAKSIAMSALHGAGRADKETLKGRAKGALGGAAMGMGGELLGRGAGSALKTVGNMKSWSVLEALGIKNAQSKRILSNHLEKTGRSVDEFADAMSKETIEEISKDGVKKSNLFEFQQTYSQTLDKVTKRMSQVSDDVNKILDVADDEIGKTVKASDLHSLLQREIVEPLQSSSEPGKKELAEKVNKYLNSMFLKETPEEIIEQIPKQIPTGVIGPDKQPVYKTVYSQQTKRTVKTDFVEDFSLRELNKLKNDVYDVIKDTAGYMKSDKMVLPREVPAIDWQKQKIGSLMQNHIDDLMKTKAISPEVYASHKAAKTKFTDLGITRKWLKDASDTVNSGPIGALKTSFRGVGGLLWGGVGAGALHYGGMKGMAAYATATAMNAWLHSAGAPATMAAGMKRISNAFVRNPERWGNAARKLLVASEASGQGLSEALANVEAQVALDEEPLQRNTADLIQKKDYVLALVEDENVRNELEEALNTNDSSKVRALMGQFLSQDRKFSRKFLEHSNLEGEWDGYAVTENSKRAVTDWIKKIRSIKKRRELLGNFGASYKIPQEYLTQGHPEPPSKMMIYKNVRDKLKKDY
ncbi:MAG: hypothetical protein CMG00_06095 [Candidatus Marinimicrobia bacterium]|nr:hypothetical protein [Candidatus Neomarinimicrobiota bacterium]